MSRQLSLDKYFKSKSSSSFSPSISKTLTMNNDVGKVIRKRSLSLRKSVTPSKCPKVSIINLCSDDDDEGNRSQPTRIVTTPQTDFTTKSFSENKNPTVSDFKVEADDKDCAIADLLHDINEICSPSTNVVRTPVKSTDGNDSDSSQKTVIYSPQIDHSPQTPSKALSTPSSSTFRSPQSGNKYFSPNKKKAVFKKISVRKNLTQKFTKCDNQEKDELFNEACLGLDDKTIFLLSIINKCINRHALWQLLDVDSQNLLSRCMHLVKPGMRLVCRLYWLKECWYKQEKLRQIVAGKDAIDDPTLHVVLSSLQENGFLTSGHNLTFEDYATLLSSDEIKEICKNLKLKINSKQDAIASLKTFCKSKSIATFFSNTSKTNDNSERVLKIMSSKVGFCYKLSDAARRTIYKLYVLMYLGINYNIIKEKNLELTLLYDKINREPYPVEDEMLDDASVVFKEKDDFESYLEAVQIYEAFQEEADLLKRIKTITETFEAYKDIIICDRPNVVPVWLRRYTPVNLYIKILEDGIQDLKKIKDYPLAVEVLHTLLSQGTYRQHNKAKWYAEIALVLQKNGQTEDAAKVLVEGFKSSLSEEAIDATNMRPRAKIIAKQISNQELQTELLDYANREQILENNLRGVHIYKQPMDRTQQKGKLKFETRSSGERTVQDVEEYCLSEYLSSGGEFTNGMHWEGRIITTMFFLLFWDIIYWKPPDCVGVFLTRFQKYPLDLFCDSFYANRRDAIDGRLSMIERCTTDELLRIMNSKWCTRPETEHSGISRDCMSWEQVGAVATCLGGRALAALCRRLAVDYRHSHSGFPDLTLWNTATNKIRFVEVKSDTDRPSMKQIQWMHYLQQNRIDTEFCYVGVHTTRCKARPVS